MWKSHTMPDQKGESSSIVTAAEKIFPVPAVPLWGALVAVQPQREAVSAKTDWKSSESTATPNLFQG